MACGGMIFIEKFSDFKKKISFILFHLIFLCCLCYYCSINGKRQSELSRLRPDTSSLVFYLRGEAFIFTLRILIFESSLSVSSAKKNFLTKSKTLIKF